MSDQVGLHNHSDGSFLDGFSKPAQMAKRARELGQKAIAITDHGEVNQHLVFQKACQVEGIKPLFGMEGYWAPDIQYARDNSLAAKDFISHLCLIAKNNQGLKNLWSLSSVAYQPEYFYRKPNADPALLRQYSEGLYASDGCLMTLLFNAVKRGDEDGARQYMATLHDIYRDNFYVELHTWQYMNPDDLVMWDNIERPAREVNQMMTDLNQVKLRLATEMGIPMVIVNDAHHAYPEHWRYKEMVWGFKNETNPDQAEGKGQKADHIMADDELYFWMDRHGVGRDIVAAAIKHSSVMADSCNVEIKPMLGMPLFSKSEEDDFEKFLVAVETGFRDKVERGGLNRDVYWARMESEIALIAEKRFAGYFLIVADYVQAARDGSWADYVLGAGQRQPMLIGPGRGSAGGSLVAWLLGITGLDPIKYGLLFERFLIRERKGFPDIDIDFPRSKRAGMKEYVAHRWGHDHVCSICTMSRNKARGTVKDLSRLLNNLQDEEYIPYKDQEAIGKLIERITAAETEDEEETSEDDTRTWAEIAEENFKEVGPWVRKYPELFADVNELTGVIRQTNVHAAAVLIADPNKEPLRELLPLRIKNGTLMTQFDMYSVEELGGLKGDFLSLRHLDALKIAADLVKERHDVDIDYETFGDDKYCDPAIWTQIDEGQTIGIFQLGTPGGTDSAIEFKPRSEWDVADLIAINRPGVRDAGLYHAYLRRRAGVEEVRYQHPMMEPITRETFGIMIYQEQLMQAARELAGFTAAEADALRKAVGKKIMQEVLALKAKFIGGCLDNNDYTRGGTVDRKTCIDTAETIWRSMEASGKYLFNKSHSFGYSLTASREIWMKHYYPAEMLVGFMRVDEAKRNYFVRDARRRGITMLPPDVNESRATYRIVGNTIRYGVDAVRGIGPAAIEKIIGAQPYSDVTDFLTRSKANKTVALNLARLGALDSLGDRVKVMKEIEWHRAAEGLAKSTLGDAAKLEAAIAKRFAENPARWTVEVPDFADEAVMYAIEQELVGSFVTIDPMAKYLKAIDEEAIRNPAAIRKYNPGQHLVLGGEIIKIRNHVVGSGRNKGAHMAFVGVEWQGDVYDVKVFPKAYEKYKILLKLGAPVLCLCERLDDGVCLVKLYRLDLIWEEYGAGN